MFEIDSSLDISHHLFWGLTADEVEPKQASFDESPATPMEWNSNTPVSSLNDDNEDTDSPMETADIPDAMHISFLKSLYQSADFDIESMDLDDDNIVSEAIPGDIDSPIIILDSDSEEDEFDVQITRKSRLPIVRQDTVSFTQPRAKRRCQYKCTLDTPPQSKCSMCHVVLTPKYGGVRARLDSQAKYKGSPCCLGCKRFISFAKTKKERDYITTYLLTGHIPSHDLPPTLSVQEVLRRLKARYHQIRSRYNHKVTENKNCPLTLNDLIRIYIKQGQLCQITGFRCYLHDTSLPRQPYWALSLDHIVPVSHQLNNHYVWSADNLQVMSTILNSIKGDANDVEIVDWYKRFLAANMVLID